MGTRLARHGGLRPRRERRRSCDEQVRAARGWTRRSWASGGHEGELIGALIVVAVRPLRTELGQTSWPSGSTLERLPGEHCDRPPLASSDVIVKDLYISVPLPSEQSPRSETEVAA